MQKETYEFAMLAESMTQTDLLRLIAQILISQMDYDDPKIEAMNLFEEIQKNMLQNREEAENDIRTTSLPQ